LKKGQSTYLYRWTLVAFNYSIRLHHWVGDDVGPHYHDHPFNFISILFKGSYTNYTPEGNRTISAPAIWYANGTKRHRLVIHGEAWTLLLCGRPYRKWGFWVNNHLWRPLRYFHTIHKKQLHQTTK
jgi:hypothetical protein